MSDGVVAALFVVAAAVSLATSWLLVSRLERIGVALGMSEALLGLVAALAADAPEITAAVTALSGHQGRIGAGVVIGSNVFNLAALLGLAAMIAGRIELHRRVIVLEGTVALLIAAVCLLVVTGALGPLPGLAATAAILVPYAAVSGVRHLERVGLPPALVRWLSIAIAEEESELEPALDLHRGSRRDIAVASVAVAVVVGASVGMEQAASTLGARGAVPPIVTGGLILAAVTSLPNAVAAIYLARRGRGAATLSTALNSNALNVAFGLLVPGSIVGIGGISGQTALVAAWYAGLTLVALLASYRGRGLRRIEGATIIAAYLGFVVALIATT